MLDLDVIEEREIYAALDWLGEQQAWNDGLPITSFGDLMRHLATMTLNEVASPQAPSAAITLSAKPTPLQNKAFALLNKALPRVQ